MNFFRSFLRKGDARGGGIECGRGSSAIGFSQDGSRRLPLPKGPFPALFVLLE